MISDGESSTGMPCRKVALLNNLNQIWCNDLNLWPRNRINSPLSPTAPTF